MNVTIAKRVGCMWIDCALADASCHGVWCCILVLVLFEALLDQDVVPFEHVRDVLGSGRRLSSVALPA